MLSSRIACVVVLACVADVRGQQANWSPARLLTPRITEMAEDPVSGGILLFGGNTAENRYAGDTWRWDGAGWALLSPTVSPSGRSGHALATDTLRNRVLLFAGRPSGNSVVNDTWEWNGTIWRRLAPSTSPGPRTWHEMVYDGARDRVVLFGGYYGLNLGETWEFNGSDWQEVFPLESPPPRRYHGMAYDAARGTSIATPLPSTLR